MTIDDVRRLLLAAKAERDQCEARMQAADAAGEVEKAAEQRERFEIGSECIAAVESIIKDSRGEEWKGT